MERLKSLEFRLRIIRSALKHDAIALEEKGYIPGIGNKFFKRREHFEEFLQKQKEREAEIIREINEIKRRNEVMA
ncbi:hypothetical protein PV433_27260 [Paenibacillus sp. GYB004]|uniref:hypothetical protein n=1 Tax=Paenibacillus sp. GYB004 TaxID=2994393 RepID=UPI002F96D4D3